jgi:hypothetical protein
LRDIIDAGNHARGGARAPAVKNANRNHGSAWCDSDHSNGIVERSNGTGDVSAVAILIIR